MVNANMRLRITEKVAKFTAQYRQAKAAGYNVTTMGLPTYETQEDFDKYRPEDAGSDYQEENEFIIEIIKGLLANNVPARPVTIHYAAYALWLDGRTHGPDSRAAYTGYLVSQEDGD